MRGYFWESSSPPPSHLQTSPLPPSFAFTFSSSLLLIYFSYILYEFGAKCLPYNLCPWTPGRISFDVILFTYPSSMLLMTVVKIHIYHTLCASQIWFDIL